VEWSDEDQIHVGKRPDLITGIHGDDPVEVHKELGEVVQEVIDRFQQTGRPLPPARTRPMREVISPLAFPEEQTELTPSFSSVFSKSNTRKTSI